MCQKILAVEKAPAGGEAPVPSPPAPSPVKPASFRSLYRYANATTHGSSSPDPSP